MTSCDIYSHHYNRFVKKCLHNWNIKQENEMSHHASDVLNILHLSQQQIWTTMPHDVLKNWWETLNNNMSHFFYHWWHILLNSTPISIFNLYVLILSDQGKPHTQSRINIISDVGFFFLMLSTFNSSRVHTRVSTLFPIWIYLNTD